METAECWEMSLINIAAPSVLSLTRQGLEPARLSHVDENLCARGAYVIAGGDTYDASIIASGSEVELAIAARSALKTDGIEVRVVSAPCFELFAMQPEDYRRDILGDKPRVGVEAAIQQGWDLFLRHDDSFIGMTGFGASAPANKLYEHFGITAPAIAGEVKRLIG